MKIVVINGSPKGEMSITLSFSKLLKNSFKQHDFYFVDAARDINKFETDSLKMEDTFKILSSADFIIWSFPVYYLSIPSQLMRFVSLLFENNCGNPLKGKYAASISTSGHYFDHTAHSYIHSASEELGMNFISNFSADAGYFLKDENRDSFLKYFGSLFERAEKGEKIRKEFLPASETGKFEYTPVSSGKASDHSFKTFIIADIPEKGGNLEAMVNAALRFFGDSSEIINIGNADIKNGCIGCCRCILEGKCIFRDDYRSLSDRIAEEADIVIYAGSIEHRFLSPGWKQFLDRGFCYGHKPVYRGKSFGFILSGMLRENRMLKEFMEGYVQAVTGSSLFEYVTDESSENEAVTEEIFTFTENMIRNCRDKLTKPQDFLGVGGEKIFRDLVYSFRWFFTDDHRFFENEGRYNFPNTDPATEKRSLEMEALMSQPGAKEHIMKNLSKIMIEPYEKIIRETA
ncbi:MAG: NAD(P)H-dependent oxidoreductase [Firmicutes bacterium]|nr:NAD(P)H-dependent oxidoreductase [Bacillota bacterium]